MDRGSDRLEKSKPFVPGKNIPPKFEDVVFSLPDPLRVRCEELRRELAETEKLIETVVYDKPRGLWCPTWSLGTQPLLALHVSWTSVEVTLYLTPEQADLIADANRTSPGSFRNWWSGARSSPGELRLNAAVEKGVRRARIVLESNEDARGVAWLLAPLIRASDGDGQTKDS